MIRPISKIRPCTFFLNDYQVLKGKCEKTMENFGLPVSVAHEARLMIDDDLQTLEAGEKALYAIHQRSENRIVKIVETAKALVTTLRPAGTRFPLRKAA
jgi:5'(3')-deoxyribonucleotidase